MQMDSGTYRRLILQLWLYAVASFTFFQNIPREWHWVTLLFG